MEHFFQDQSIVPPFDRLRAVSVVEPLLHCSKANALCAFALAPQLPSLRYRARRATPLLRQRPPRDQGARLLPPGAGLALCPATLHGDPLPQDPDLGIAPAFIHSRLSPPPLSRRSRLQRSHEDPLQDVLDGRIRTRQNLVHPPPPEP